MNLGAILIGIALLVATIPYVISPLANERKKQPVRPVSPAKDGAGAQKNTLAAIRDLDFDFQTGKVIREDYEALRAQLILEAAEYLQVKQQEDEKIEAMIRARLQQVKTTVVCEKCGGVIRPQDRFCPVCGIPVESRAEPEAPAEAACPGCGKNVHAGDLFCTACGTHLAPAPASEDAASPS